VVRISEKRIYWNAFRNGEFAMEEFVRAGILKA